MHPICVQRCFPKVLRTQVSITMQPNGNLLQSGVNVNDEQEQHPLVTIKSGHITLCTEKLPGACTCKETDECAVHTCDKLYGSA